MDPIQLRQAIAEIRNLRKDILEKQLFKGYSGRARVIGGTVALIAGLTASLSGIPGSGTELFILWGAVFIAAVIANYGAVLTWVVKNKSNRTIDISFIFEIWPIWFVSGVLTISLWTNGMEDLLYGTWMCLFGLAQTLHRSRLPRLVSWVGIYYISIGTLCLVFSDGIFSNPVIMGVTFFVGELAAGIIMHTSNGSTGKSILFALKPTIHE